MGDETERDDWIFKTARVLALHLGELGYDDEDFLRELAGMLYDLPEAGEEPRGMPPDSLLLQALLRQQGFDPATASIMATAAPRADWSRLTAPSRLAAEILGVNRVRLLRLRQSGQVRPMIDHREIVPNATMTYWLPDLLYTLATDRHRDRRGGPGNRRITPPRKQE